MLEISDELRGKQKAGGAGSLCPIWNTEENPIVGVLCQHESSSSHQAVVEICKDDPKEKTRGCSFTLTRKLATITCLWQRVKGRQGSVRGL